MRVIDGRTEQRTPLQPARKLPGQLFHAIDRRRLRHVFAQHVEVLMEDRALVGECWFEDRASVHRVLDLAEDPRIGHRAAANQHTIATRLTKLVESALDGRNVAAA